MRSFRIQSVRFFLLVLGITALSPLSQAFLFGPKGDGESEKKSNIRRQRGEMLSRLYTSRPELRQIMKGAAGYATFSQVQVNLLLLATANGYGVVTDNTSGREVFMRMASLGGGVGAGVKDVRVIFIFHDPALMKQFIEEGWQFGGQAEAAGRYKGAGVSAEHTVQGNVSFTEGAVGGGSSTSVAAGTDPQKGLDASVATRGGMEIYQFTESGVALQATVSGTKYWKDAKLNK